MIHHYQGQNIEICDYCNNLLQRDCRLDLDTIVTCSLFKDGKQISHVQGCPEANTIQWQGYRWTDEESEQPRQTWFDRAWAWFLRFF